MCYEVINILIPNNSVRNLSKLSLNIKDPFDAYILEYLFVLAFTGSIFYVGYPIASKWYSFAVLSVKCLWIISPKFLMTWIQENKHLYEFFNPNWIDIVLEMSVSDNCLLHYLPIQTHERPNNNIPIRYQTKSPPFQPLLSEPDHRELILVLYDQTEKSSPRIRVATQTHLCQWPHMRQF